MSDKTICVPWLREFDESQHPRDEQGRWTSGGGGGGDGADEGAGGGGEGKHPGEGYSKHAREVNGVILTTKVADAQLALSQNRKVELDQPRKVSVLLDRLGKVSKEMIDKGKQAPLFNLCNVSVKGESLFCQDNKGIPRAEMPQLDDEQTKQFRKYLKDQGYNIEKDKTPASHLRATQNELNGAKVAGVAETLRNKPDHYSKRIIVSKDDYILDGHHHWAAKIGLDAEDGNLTNDTKVKISRVDISITKLLEEAEKFTGGKGKKPATESTTGKRYRAAAQVVGEFFSEGDRAMPITPRKGEDKDTFISRCMHELAQSGTERPNDQMVAICQSAWRDAHGGEKPKSFKTDRAYSILNIKSFDDEQRIIEGVATTPSTDRVGDIVEPMGAKFSLPFPLLWQHRADEPVGYVESAQPAEDGIKFRARLAKIDEPGELKNLCDKAWQAVKAKLVKAVSIGFTIKDAELLKKGGLQIKDWEWLELSLVTIPANQDATIHTIRSIDTELMERSKPSRTAGASKSTLVVKIDERPIMAKKTIAEQLSAFEATRHAKAARMEEIMDTAGEKGVTLDAEQKQEYDNIADELKQVDEHIARLKVLEKTNIAKAVALPEKVSNPEDASRAREPIRVSTHRRELEKGVRMVRMLRALYEGNGNLFYARDLARQNEQWKAESPEIEGALSELIQQKVAVVPGDASTTAWAGVLVQYQYLASDFAEFLYPLTVIGRIPGLRRVPFKVRVPRQTAAAGVGWVGEGRAKPLTQLAFDSVTLDYAKIAGIIPLTEELVRLSNPAAETIVRDSLSAAIVKFMDAQFLDPTKAADDVSPASITNGLTAIVPSGTNAAAFRADVNRLLDTFLANNYQMGGAVWIMTQTNAMRLANMVNTLGQAEFPSVNIDGGSLLGIPIVASNNIPSTTGSPSEGYPLIIALAPEILLADDGAVTIDVSREASLQMDTAPDSPPTASTVTVSLWQQNLIAVKAERFINWKLRRSTAVAYIQSAVYTG
jgi:HK97 family phage prohead protease